VASKSPLLLALAPDVQRFAICAKRRNHDDLSSIHGVKMDIFVS